MKGKKILLGITGSIAAYKTILLVRLLVKAGAEVKVVMTPAARDFVSPLVLSTLSRNEVLTGLATDVRWANHVMLGRWADLFLIAPLTCNTLAKMATGLCDNLLLATYLSATCPVAVAPAMDEDMWYHATTRQNLQALETAGVRIIPVNDGELASGLSGPGRMAEPEALFHYLESALETPALMPVPLLSGVEVVVTAGPTHEPIDPVRFIGNHSSGKMGIAIANALQQHGATVTLVLGPTNLLPNPDVQVVKVQTAREMYAAVMDRFPAAGVAVMAAAVADYRPAAPAEQKIKKQEEVLTLELVKNPDILKACGTWKQPGQVLVGFALETNNATEYALTKLEEKNADLLILNMAGRPGEGFATDTNKISIFDRNGAPAHHPLMTKEAAAGIIVNRIIQKRNENQ